MNDGDSIGQRFSLVSACTDSTVNNNFVTNKNHRMRDELNDIYRFNRRTNVPRERMRGGGITR